MKKLRKRRANGKVKRSEGVEGWTGKKIIIMLSFQHPEGEI